MTKPTVRERDWFRIEARADEEESTAADVYIYDEIGERWYGGGVGARSFAQQLDELDVDTIRLHLNSPGGAAWDGITIMNALRRHRARVEVTVDGLAASAASVIAMAGDRITMSRGSELMIHDASGGAWGPAELMEETAGILHKLSDSIADVYAARAGKGRAHWRELMVAETWYTAEEAVTAGLADDWEDAPASTARGEFAPAARFDLSMFAYAGRAKAPAPRLETPELPSSSEPGEPNRKENAVAYSDLTAGIRERLGVTDADAPDETLLAALDEALEERAETPAAPAAIPEGAVVMDAAALAELRENAALGAQARREQESARRDAIVARAVAEGRITPASSGNWRAQLDKDEAGITQLLSSFAANTIPVEEIGHSDTLTSADDSLYGNVYGSTEKEA